MEGELLREQGRRSDTVKDISASERADGTARTLHAAVPDRKRDMSRVPGNRRFLGIDTSNYTTSAAVCEEDGTISESVRKLLTVKEGERGLRQSDAVFAHTVNIPGVVEQLGSFSPTAVGVSSVPRDCPGSYMPCFLAGKAAASAVASLFGVPLYEFSHQRGHLAAALYSCGREDLYDGEFLAFHVSGGTTELLHVKDREIQLLGGTSDISAGKAIDRIGVTLGLHFPCGAALEQLASSAERTPKPRISVSGCSCNFSGLENLAAELVRKGTPPCEIAAFVLSCIGQTLERMTEHALARFPGLPVIYAGGVMSNRLIRPALKEKFDAYFAEPQFSCDNAAGIALLCRRRWEETYG